jgi:tripartite ATP-independent transporter DctM subunit
VGIELITALMVAAMVVMVAMGLPLAFTTGAIGTTAAFLRFGPAGLEMVAGRVYSFINEYVLVSVPMFILMAALMERSGVATDLFRAMHVWAGGLRGGLAVQTLLAATLMAAMTGIIGGEIVLLGLIALPQMLQLKYDRRLAIGVICAGGSLGTMIPPSIVLVVYGLTANVSIGDLLMATIVPGLLMAGIYVTYVLVRCHLDPRMGPPAPAEERRLPLRQKLAMLKGLVLPLFVAATVLGTIYTGVASVTEAAGMGVVGMALSAAVRRELGWQMARESLLQTMATCGVLIWLSMGAFGLIGVYNVLGGNQFVRSAVANLPFPPILIVATMMGILFVLGMFLDWIGICVLTMPVFVPIVVALGFDPVWFGILFTMNMQMSYLTPPFGPAAFYLKGVAPPDMTLQEIFSAVWPWIGLQALALGIMMAFPRIALWLPSVVYGR